MRVCSDVSLIMKADLVGCVFIKDLKAARFPAYSVLFGEFSE